MSPLDRPVWESLTTHHAPLSIGGASARRFARDINLFAAAVDDAPASLAALAELVGPDEEIYVVERAQIAIPEGLKIVKQAPGVQMVASVAVPVIEGAEAVLDLHDDDAPEMLALARLTEPGPFLPRTHVMGHFRGVRIGGRLAAMAGERMRFPGFTEVSGVCTHPDFRGRGLARRLSSIVAAAIQARGETPFLHAWRTNAAAITLYEGLGFARRCEMNVAALARV